MLLLDNKEINQQKYFFTSQDISAVSQQSWMWLLQESQAAKASGSMSQRRAKQISMGTAPPLYLFRLVLDFDVSVEARDF